MKKSTMLQGCVLAQLCGISLTVACMFALESALPEPLAAWVKTQAERDYTGADILLLNIFLLALGGTLIGAFGLLFLQKWGAWIYLAATVAGILVTPLSGPMVEHSLTGTFDQVATILSGVVLALAFFTDSLDPKPRLVIRAVPAGQGEPPLVLPGAERN